MQQELELNQDQGNCENYFNSLTREILTRSLLQNTQLYRRESGLYRHEGITGQYMTMRKPMDNTGQYRTIQDNTAQYKTIQDNTGQYRSIMDNTCTGRYRTIKDNIGQFRTIQSNTDQYRTIEDYTDTRQNRTLDYTGQYKEISLIKTVVQVNN